MKNMPEVLELSNGAKGYVAELENCIAKMVVPQTDKPVDIINFGFRAPYLIYFEEEQGKSLQESADFAEKSGLAKIASSFGSGVLFVSSKAEGGWDKAPKNIYQELMEESAISQYYKDGAAIMWNRFEKKWEDYYLRGTVSRAMLYGKGKAADYIAANYLCKVEGKGMFGPGDITPVVCTLENLSVVPEITRKDIPVVSVGNSDEINAVLQKELQDVLVKDASDYPVDFKTFTGTFRRMVGFLNPERDYDALNMTEKYEEITVETASDNRGDDKDTKQHRIGYITYYNNGALEKGEKLPLVLCFHGGGDSVMFMGEVSGWPLVANKYNFILVAIENHLNSTATEMMDLIAHLKEEYPIDECRIYASGFSMGGCKSWDMYQEYPGMFAGVAPMDATFEVGCNSYGNEIEDMNEDTIVPVFYAGGEVTPLPELPCQAQKCLDRMKYVFEVNQVRKECNVELEDKDNWQNKFYGINGDVTVVSHDDNRNSDLTLELFASENGCCYSVFGVVSGQGHEVRHHTCENAWKFLQNFYRAEDGSIVGGEMKKIVESFQDNN